VTHEGTVILAGLPVDGVARSTDDGQTWTLANDGLAASLLVGFALSPTFGHDRTIFAASLQRGLSVSTDGGRSWAERNDGLDDTTVSQVAAWRSPSGTPVVCASTATGLYLSRDAGVSWQPALPDEPSTPARAVALALAPGSRNVAVLAALPGGRLFSTRDEGVSWDEMQTRFGGGEIVVLALSPSYSVDGTIFVVTAGLAAHDGTSELVVWRSTDRGQRWERWLEGRGTGPIQLVALPPNRFGDTVVAGLEGRVLRPRQNAWEVRGGARRPVWDAVELADDARPGRPAAITGLAASPEYERDRTVFAASSAGVFVSRDGGASFAAWNDGLDPLAAVAVAPSPAYAHDRLLYVLGLGGTIWCRRDL
jgi:photosystem II stability/assembly factor-like uncharacterized protein